MSEVSKESYRWLIICSEHVVKCCTGTLTLRQYLYSLTEVP